MTEKRDKRDECGCHKECTYVLHECEKPCRWPDCMTPEEEAELLDSLSFELEGPEDGGEVEA